MKSLTNVNLRFFDFVAISNVFSMSFGHILRFETSRKNNLVVIETKKCFENLPNSDQNKFQFDLNMFLYVLKYDHFFKYTINYVNKIFDYGFSL